MGDHGNCSDLNSIRLAAMMLAPTWEEAAASPVDTSSPSPMAMGRSDLGFNRLYSFSTTADQERAVWHPGVGTWQLDDAGLGTFLSANQRINVPTAGGQGRRRDGKSVLFRERDERAAPLGGVGAVGCLQRRQL